MSHFGAAFLFLFLLALTSAGWYWLFKRFERRMSERFDELTRMAIVTKQKAETLDAIQGLLLVVKQELVFEASLRDLNKRLEEGSISKEEFTKLNRLLDNMRLENFSKY